MTGGRLNAASALTALRRRADADAHPHADTIPTLPRHRRRPRPDPHCHADADAHRAAGTTPAPTAHPRSAGRHAHPAPTAGPPAPAATVKSLKITGTRHGQEAGQGHYSLSKDATVTIVVRCAGSRACASTAPVRASKTGKTGTWSFDLTRKQNGKALPAGRYTLTLSTGASSRSVGFTVR